MSKARKPYQGPDADTDDDNEPNVAVKETEKDIELQELERQQVEAAEVGMPPSSVVDPYEKRYNDLRSYASKRENALNKEMDTLKTTVSNLQKNVELQKKAGGFTPTSDEELTAWSSANPDAYRIVRSLIAKEQEDRIISLQDQIQVLSDGYSQDKADLSLRAIKALHPDFEDIINSDDFKLWLEDAPEETQKIMYESFDVKKGDWVLNAYKKDKGVSKKPVTKADLSAAMDVKKPSNPSPELQKGYAFRESEISKMGDAEYDAKEADIEKARREGRILLDMSNRSRIRA